MSSGAVSDCHASGCDCTAYQAQFYRPTMCVTCYHTISDHIDAWERKIDPESRRPVFVHRDTGERLWARPQARVAAVVDLARAAERGESHDSAVPTADGRDEGGGGGRPRRTSISAALEAKLAKWTATAAAPVTGEVADVAATTAFSEEARGPASAPLSVDTPEHVQVEDVDVVEPPQPQHGASASSVAEEVQTPVDEPVTVESRKEETGAPVATGVSDTGNPVVTTTDTATVDVAVAAAVVQNPELHGETEGSSAAPEQAGRDSSARFERDLVPSGVEEVTLPVRRPSARSRKLATKSPADDALEAVRRSSASNEAPSATDEAFSLEGDVRSGAADRVSAGPAVAAAPMAPPHADSSPHARAPPAEEPVASGGAGGSHKEPAVAAPMKSSGYSGRALELPASGEILSVNASELTVAGPGSDGGLLLPCRVFALGRVAARHLIVTPSSLIMTQAHPTAMGRAEILWERSLSSISSMWRQPVDAVTAAALGHQDGVGESVSVLVTFTPEAATSMSSLLVHRRGLRPEKRTAILRKSKPSSWRGRGWKTRRCVLEEASLAYYEASAGSHSPPKGIIDLRQHVEVFMSDKRAHAFGLRSLQAFHVFAAASDEEAAAWRRALQGNALFCDCTNPGFSTTLILSNGEAANALRRFVAEYSPSVSAEEPAGVDVGSAALAGATYVPQAAVLAKRPPPSSLWFYVDDSDEQQGPFEAAVMREWLEEGHFREDTPVRNADAALFLPISELWPDRPDLAFLEEGDECWREQHHLAEAYQSMVSTAVQLGLDQGTVLRTVFLMRQHRIPPDMPILLDLMGVGTDDAPFLGEGGGGVGW